jgi:hypothetical protein
MTLLLLLKFAVLLDFIGLQKLEIEPCSFKTIVEDPLWLFHLPKT